jgi:hypothetical protein
MAGLDPAIYALCFEGESELVRREGRRSHGARLATIARRRRVDGRVKPGHDG